MDTLLRRTARLAALSLPDPAAPVAAHEITEIGLARDMCYGPSPVYLLRLRRSGDARFEGDHFVDLMGKHRARVSRDALGYTGARLGRPAVGHDLSRSRTATSGCRPALTNDARRATERQVKPGHSAARRNPFVVEAIGVVGRTYRPA